jgi:hypothetical protein
MKYFIIFLVLASLVSFTGNNSVYGLSCGGANMTQSFAESDAVFAGQVQSKEYIPSERSSGDGENDAITQFSIIENFKGISQETISIISSEWLWGYNFTKNLEYVVFAYDDGQYLRHQTCTPTSLLEHAELEKIRQVANDLELVVANSTHVKWNVGEVQWLEASYPPSGTGVVRIIDPDMNLNPEKVDNIDIDVWSDSYAKGFTSTATETGVSTGIFESAVFLTLNHESAGQRLKVAEGDTITAEYEDNTLPASYTTVDVLHITAKSNIRAMLDSPLEQFRSGISIDEIECNDSLVLIQKHDGSPACVKPETKSKLIQRDWIYLQFSFCGSGGFDSKGNLNKSNSTHTWDENECEWTIPSDKVLKSKAYIANCDETLHKEELPDFTIENSTHNYDMQYCKWELKYPDLTLISNEYLLNDYPYCAELFDTLFDYYQSIRDPCGMQRYNEDGTPRAICTPAPAGAGIPRDINMIKSGCIDHYSDWAYQTKHNDDVFYLFDRKEINNKIHGTLDEQIGIIEKLCDDNDYRNAEPNIKFRNNTHWIDTDHCSLNIKDQK